MIMSKFNVYDRVKIMRGRYKDKIALITEVKEREDDDGYNYILTGVDDNFYLLTDEDALESAPTVTGENIFLDYLNESTNHKEPKFEVGDVVNITDHPDNAYVIKESILVNTGESAIYMYEVNLLNGDEDRITRCIESSLTLQYHDLSYEKYFSESYRHRSLPQWRGELYNFYICYLNIDAHGKLDKATVDEYENHTIPPKRMEHILRSHSIYDRIWDVVLNDGNSRWSSNREQIRRNLGIDDDELDHIAYSIRDKINARNKNDLNPANLKKADIRNPDFTDQEYRFIDEIDKLDISKGNLKDHFPVTMTNLQIMDAIKEVYMSKELIRVGSKQICDSKNKRADEDLDAPRLGKIHYRGHSDKYDIDIEFLYNFDYNFIETAYPIRMNNNSKKR